MNPDIEKVINEISEALAPLESQRLALDAPKKKEARIFAVIATTSVLLSLYLTFRDLENVKTGFLSVAFIGIFIGIFLNKTSGKEINLRQMAKQQLMSRLLDAIHPGLHYDSTSGISKEIFTSTRMFPHKADLYTAEDLIKGRVGETDVMFCEVSAQYRKYESDSATNLGDNYETFFSGIFMRADFHKKFRGTLRIVPESKSLLAGLASALMSFKPFSSEKLIQLEDAEFEEIYKVYGSDEIEARYILSPDMMRRILDLRKVWNSEIRLSFSLSKIYIAIQDGCNFFDAHPENPLNCKDRLRQIAYEIRACLDIVDQLNLNTRIWTKN